MASDGPGPAPRPATATASPDAAERALARVATLERRIAVLSETVRGASALLDPGMVARYLMERAGELCAANRWRLYRLDEAAGLLRLDAKDGAETGAAAVLALDRGLAGWVARNQELVRVPAGAADARLADGLEWPVAPAGEVVALPLVSRGRIIGVAELAAPPGCDFGETEIELLLAVAEPAAIALDNALLFRKLEERTVTDDLTHLYNARFMENYLRRETKRAQRYRNAVSLLFLDLDGFKNVNDSYGHMAGSRTLVEVGELLRGAVRDLDVVARWGGDEFAVVLPETGPEGALTSAERIRELIGGHVYLVDFGLAVRISVSIGVASCPEHGTTAEALLGAADGAMYHVKNSGKNGVLVARPKPATT